MGPVPELGRRLRRLREAKKMTQAELARLCGLGESTISFYESGKREPGYEVLLCLAEKLGTTPNYLLTGKEAPAPGGGAGGSWWEKDTEPTEIELEEFIRSHENLRLFGDPLSKEVKEDIMLALRTAWEIIKKERAAAGRRKGQ